MNKRVDLINIANAVGFLMVIVVNTLANSLPLNNITTGELADKYYNLFTPAAYVFSIWFVIYLLLGAFTIFQLLPKNRDEEFVKKIGWLFPLSCVFNSVWIFFWHYEYLLLSLLVMFGLLFSLIGIYLRLDVGRFDVEPEVKRYVHLPFSVYLGWITVAPIANVAAYLVSIGWPSVGMSAIYMTIIVIVVAVGLSFANIILRADVGYNLVLVWALIGILVKQMETPLIPYVAGAGALGIAVLLVWKKLY
jgi:hypothetical protein